MRLLADENCPIDIVDELRHPGHDVVWIRTDAPGSKDPDTSSPLTKRSRSRG